jgi:hypothetical protein
LTAFATKHFFNDQAVAVDLVVQSCLDQLLDTQCSYEGRAKHNERGHQVPSIFKSLWKRQDDDSAVTLDQGNVSLKNSQLTSLQLDPLSTLSVARKGCRKVH